MEIKCSNDGEFMEKGVVDKGLWVEGDWVGLFKAMTKPIGNKKYGHILGWRCPKCGKVDLYTEIQ
jgi:hypothetical protein